MEEKELANLLEEYHDAINAHVGTKGAMTAKSLPGELSQGVVGLQL